MGAARELPGGLLLRPAVEADHEQVVAVNVALHGARTEWHIRALLKAGRDPWCVVVDGDRVVSTLCLIHHRLRLCGIELEAGQVEFVGTVPGYRNRGLVRAQVEEVHGWSSAANEIVTFITGIPYYYRLFGYEYAFTFPAIRPVPVGSAPSMPVGWEVVDAAPSDLDALRDLHARASAANDLVALRSDIEWGWLFDEALRWGEQAVVARRDGEVQAYGRVLAGMGRDTTYVQDIAAASLDGARAIVAHAAAVARAHGHPLKVLDRPGTALTPVLDPIASGPGFQESGYARLADPIAVLDRLRPVLSARLASSLFADESGELALSLYRSGLAIAYERGEVVSITEIAGEQEPADVGGAGVPPDHLATLVLGRFGAAGLAARVDDVTLGTHAALMGVLFPRVRSDIVLVV